MTNAGSITISSSGESQVNEKGELQYGYGIYNQGLFTSSGHLHYPSLPISDDSRGLYNGGSFTNIGTFTNNRGSYDGDPISWTWGSYNESGTMINYGTTNATGTFFNSLIMLNYGIITSSGTFADETGDSMINYGKFYNYGTIYGGTNKGICIDEPLSGGGCG